MFLKTFLQANQIKKAWRYVCLGVCVFVSWCVFECVHMYCGWLWGVDCPNTDKAASSGFVCNAHPPPLLVVCCVGMWRLGL